MLEAESVSGISTRAGEHSEAEGVATSAGALNSAEQGAESPSTGLRFPAACTTSSVIYNFVSSHFGSDRL